MNFTSNLTARKYGFQFSIRYDKYLSGEEQENKYSLFVAGPKMADGSRESCYTERSLRFATKELAMAFCEEIASGKVTIAELRAAEEKAWSDFRAKEVAAAEQKVEVFLDKMRSLGVNPVLVPEILAAYQEMNNTLDSRARLIFFDRLEDLKKQPESKKDAPGLTLGEYMNINRDDIDVCLVDSSTGEHLLPAVSYLSDEQLASGKYCHSDWEKWVMSLPIDHIQNAGNCPLAVVKTDFNWDQVCFLLEKDEFESTEWKNLSFRADCACVGTNERLAFLNGGAPFETVFDASRMDGLTEAQRARICEMLKDSNHVYIHTVYEEDREQSYVYQLREDPFDGELWFDFDKDVVPIKFTEPGKGLSSTLDGKVAWASHTANKSRQNASAQPEHMKNNERE